MPRIGRRSARPSACCVGFSADAACPSTTSQGTRLKDVSRRRAATSTSSANARNCVICSRREVVVADQHQRLPAVGQLGSQRDSLDIVQVCTCGIVDRSSDKSWSSSAAAPRSARAAPGCRRHRRCWPGRCGRQRACRIRVRWPGSSRRRGRPDPSARCRRRSARRPCRADRRIARSPARCRRRNG